MSNLQHLFRAWTPYFSIYQTLQACVFGRNAKTDSSRVYRLEAVGSGALLGTIKDLTPYFATHRLFLGHGGRELTRNSRFPPSYTGPIVLLSIQFQGQIQYSSKDRDARPYMWNRHDTVVYFAGYGNKFVMQTLNGANAWILEHEHGITHALWNPQGTLFACISPETSIVYIWNNIGEQIDEFTHIHIAELYADVKWSPDGQRLVITCVDDGIHMILWEDCTIRSFGHYPIPIDNWNFFSHTAQIIWDPTSSFVAICVAGHDTVWNCDGACIWTYDHSRHHYFRMLWHPTTFGEFCTSSNLDHDHNLKLIRYKILDDVTKKVQVQTLNTIHPSYICQSCCGTLAIRGMQKNAWVVLHNAVCVTIKTRKRIYELVWHPHKEILGMIIRKTIYLWNAHAKHKLVKLCECLSKKRHICWNPRGTLLACQTDWTRIKMYQENGTFCKTIVSPHPIQDMQWSANGQTLQVKTSASIDFWT